MSAGEGVWKRGERISLLRRRKDATQEAERVDQAARRPWCWRELAVRLWLCDCVWAWVLFWWKARRKNGGSDDALPLRRTAGDLAGGVG